MAHPNDQTLRTAYEAFGRGDFEGYLSHCTADVIFHIPGRNPVSGTYTRAQFLDPFIKRLGATFGGTFREKVIDVFANDDRGVVLARHDFSRRGVPFTYLTVHLYAITEGRLAEFREFPEDQYALDAALA